MEYPGASILCRILSDLIGSDDPTKSYRIPGDGFTPDSVRQIYQNLSSVPNFTSSRFSYKPPRKRKGSGPSIMANHIGSKFGPILLGKKQNLHEAAPPEGPF
jgi:hypothetical protein